MLEAINANITEIASPQKPEGVTFAWSRPKTVGQTMSELSVLELGKEIVAIENLMAGNRLLGAGADISHPLHREARAMLAKRRLLEGFIFTTPAVTIGDAAAHLGAAMRELECADECAFDSEIEREKHAENAKAAIAIAMHVVAALGGVATDDVGDTHWNETVLHRRFGERDQGDVN